jgi:hypothetical protein
MGEERMHFQALAIWLPEPFVFPSYRFIPATPKGGTT